ncbi:hypothetical protein [Methylobacterium aerolatum]|uniref:DNA-binding NarL/FixJ family response regulator n=1 Tax=Methylobacterium aerolatum TaxID=418708 RepID=A0ABU0HTR1_9HYPH|nr:hypothetical protein [Methylobacterium aerolatum]MDQ0445719.1 DNA-binding NarL/FixJ family response regulator [Methylobacterium aerolatum]GJD36171.1 hypothetical protein FMGBMHLM_3085 [Methylobacterium aerolatum]
MSDPLGATASLPPHWLAAARDRATELGFGPDLAALGDAPWEVVCQAVELTVADDRPIPPDWRAALARQAGRTSSTDLRQDRADARLAEVGEVFAVDDDA